MTQQLSLKEQLKALESLQEIDLRIFSLKQKKNSLPGTLKSSNDLVHKTKVALEAKKNAVAELEKAQRQTQAAIEINNDRLNRSSEKLEAVKNSSEYNAANKEIDQLKKLSASLQDQLKKTAQELETANQDMSKISADFEKAQSEHAASAAELASSDSKIQGDINGLMNERKEFTAHIEPRLLAQYDRIRNARGGVGVVPAVGGRCQGCNIHLPPQLFNEIQRGNQIHFCPSCNRILMIPSNATPPQSHAAGT